MQHQIKSFADVHRVVDDWSRSTPKFRHGLDYMHKLLEHLGNPHKQLRVVHVAGTSGKTSTAYYVAALLQASGKKVGLTVSPHVDEVNERAQIDLRPIPEAEFCARFSEFVRIVEDFETPPNYFELFIAFAFWEFAARKVDYAVVEVGIGGLLDSTNVFDDPDKVCVITDIGYDHTGILGDSITEIAGWKAGIIQLRNSVFCNRQDAEIMDVIQKEAEKKQADLHILTPKDQNEGFNFLPLFQRRNLNLSLAAFQFVSERDGLVGLSEDQIMAAAHTHIPARMEAFERGGKTVILDIAHNGQKLHSLIESVREKYPGQGLAALIRMPARDPSMRRTTEGLIEAAKGVDHIIMTSLAEEGDPPDDSFDEGKLEDVFLKLGYSSFEFVPEPKEAFGVLTSRAEPILLVTGSTFLLNHIRPLVGVSKP